MYLVHITDVRDKYKQSNMTSEYIRFKESENIIPLLFKDKEQYYYDLMNIENSWTGRIDALYSNEFFREAVQMIINAIVLFEKGYFDCAFYSLRQSMEISTTIIYFIDNSEDKRKSEIQKWKNQEKFPMNNQMINELKNRKLVFSDLKEKMSDFFNDVEESKQRLNKYVHKQGLDKFYVHTNNPLNKISIEKRNKKIIEDFTEFLIKSIGVVAIFRLAIDPFPLLLADDDIYKRTGQLMTEGYNDEFIEKYIGQDNILAYKKTELYQGYYAEIIKNEEMLPAVIDVVKNDFIDRDKIDEIYSQIHLLGLYERFAVLLVGVSAKITKIYCYGGWSWHFTNLKSKRKRSNFNSETLSHIKDKDYNIPFEEVFLSGFKAYEELLHIEHNEEFNSTELNQLETTIENLNTAIANLDNAWKKILDEMKNTNP